MYLGFASLELLGVWVCIWVFIFGVFDFSCMGFLGIWVFIVGSFECLGFYLDSQFSSVLGIFVSCKECLGMWVFIMWEFVYLGFHFWSIWVFRLTCLERLGVWIFMYRGSNALIDSCWESHVYIFFLLSSSLV